MAKSRGQYFLLFFFQFFLASGAIAGENPRTICSIRVEGNKITREKVIRRELVFHEGDTLDNESLAKAIARSKENLLNTSLFNYVFFTSRDDSLRPACLQVNIRVEERWYVWPFPILEPGNRNLSNYLNERKWYKINYGVYLQHDNSTGRDDILKLKARYGYKEQFAIVYDAPRLGKTQAHGLEAEFSYFRKREIQYLTREDQPVYFSADEGFIWQSAEGLLGYKYRPEFYTRYYARLLLHHYRVADTIMTLNPGYLGNGQNLLNYLSVGFGIVHDKRDAKVYPLQGLYADLFLYRQGLGILSWDIPPNYTGTGKFSLSGNITGPFFYHLDVKGHFSTSPNLGFEREKLFGYTDYIRGYEYHVMNGIAYIASRNNLKYELLPPRVSIIPYIPWKKFNKIHYAIYLNLFFDHGYVYTTGLVHPSNQMVNSWIQGTGIGLDLVTYYDKVFRVEYSRNRHTGKWMVHLHLNAPIWQENYK
jgi:outer membrane protein assembly factor BamA